MKAHTRENNTSPLRILCTLTPQIIPLRTLTSFIHGMKSPNLEGYVLAGSFLNDLLELWGEGVMCGWGVLLGYVETKCNIAHCYDAILVS